MLKYSLSPQRKSYSEHLSQPLQAVTSQTETSLVIIGQKSISERSLGGRKQVGHTCHHTGVEGEMRYRS